MKKLQGKTIWLTGATSGIGLSLAKQLAAMGNHVIASGRNETALQRLVDETDGAISKLPIDLTDDLSVTQGEQKLSVLTDTLDLVIVNAGNCEYLDIEQFDSDLIERVFAINFFGAVQTVKVALPLLANASSPQIAVISSLSTVVPFGRAEAYGASKAALEYFANSMAIDLHHNGVDVSVIRPGFVKTPLTDKNTFDMPFIMSADDAAKRIIYGIERRRPLYEFPRRLAWTLRLCNTIPAIWRRVLAPGLARHRSAAW